MELFHVESFLQIYIYIFYRYNLQYWQEIVIFQNALNFIFRFSLKKIHEGRKALML